MPFTLSHPVAVLAIPRSPYLHRSALVIGSMSPDFIYYLVETHSKIGHTLLGAVGLDLPLCFIVFYLYLIFIQPYFWCNLPRVLSLQTTNQRLHSPRDILIFSLSALLGIATHIALDYLLHKSSDLLVTLDFVQPYHQGLRIYRLYRSFISVIALCLIVIYWRQQAKKQPLLTTLPRGKKWLYWGIVSGITATIATVGQPPLTGLAIDALAIRMVASLFLGMLLTGMIYRGKQLIVGRSI